MPVQFTLQDLAIAITAKDLNPTVVNPDLLKYSGVVPSDWELARAPITTKQGVQVAFANGLTIMAEPKRVMFAEPLLGKSTEEILLADMIQKYSQILPNVEFKTASVNIRGYITVQDRADKYVVDQLLSTGDWKDDCIGASLNLIFKSDRSPLYLTIADALLQKDDETKEPIVMFVGRFNYDLKGETAEDSSRNLRQITENLSFDIGHFTEVIERKFLQIASDDHLEVPNLFAMASDVV